MKAPTAEEIANGLYHDLVDKIEYQTRTKELREENATLEKYNSLLIEEKESLRERVKELEALMQEFVDRVDRGEVRSKKTYAKFKEALKS